MPKIRIVSAGINVIFCMIWIVLNRFYFTKASIMSYLWLLYSCILTNLSLRDLMPEVMLESEKSSDEIKIFVAMIFSHSVNYNKYTTVLILYPLTVIVACYFQYLRMADIWTDPYSGIAPSTDE